VLCETVCLLPEITDIINSGQFQWQYKSGAAKRKLKVEQERRDEQIKKKCHVCWHMGLTLAWFLTLNIRSHHWVKIMSAVKLTKTK